MTSVSIPGQGGTSALGASLPVTSSRSYGGGAASAQRGVFTLVLPGSRVSITPWTVTEDGTGGRVLNVGFPTIELRAC